MKTQLNCKSNVSSIQMLCKDDATWLICCIKTVSSSVFCAHASTYTHHIHTERCNAYYLLKCTAKTMLHASTGPQARDSRENIVSPVSSIHKHKFSTLMERICYLIYLYFIIERVTERHVLSHIYIYGWLRMQCTYTHRVHACTYSCSNINSNVSTKIAFVTWFICSIKAITEIIIQLFMRKTSRSISTQDSQCLIVILICKEYTTKTHQKRKTKNKKGVFKAL